MEKLFQDLFEDPSLLIFLEEKWGSQNPPHRELIKTHLNQETQKLSKRIHTSISHTQGLGGYALSRNPLGFDVEVSGRVQTQVALRISNKSELEKAPSPTALWCAKEAGFKALQYFFQPKTINQLKLEFNNPLPSGLVSFRLTNESDFGAYRGCGAVLSQPDFTYGLMVFGCESHRLDL